MLMVPVCACEYPDPSIRTKSLHIVRNLQRHVRLQKKTESPEPPFETLHSRRSMIPTFFVRKESGSGLPARNFQHLAGQNSGLGGFRL